MYDPTLTGYDNDKEYPFAIYCGNKNVMIGCLLITIITSKLKHKTIIWLIIYQQLCDTVCNIMYYASRKNFHGIVFHGITIYSLIEYLYTE